MTAEQILEGTFDTEHQLSEVTRFMQKCNKDPRIQPFLQEVTQTMFNSTFSGLSEKKSSSNSRRHIGHYKATLECETIIEIHCRMMSIPFKHGITPDGWTKVTDVMLEKNPGVPRLHGLRVIQLLEADLNQCPTNLIHHTHGAQIRPILSDIHHIIPSLTVINCRR